MRHICIWMYRTVHSSYHTNCSLSVECLLDARLWRRFFMKYAARETTAFEFLKVDAATYSRVQYCIVCTQAVLDSTLNALESRGNAIKSECYTVLLSSTSLRGGDGPKRRCAPPPSPRRSPARRPERREEQQRADTRLFNSRYALGDRAIQVLRIDNTNENVCVFARVGVPYQTVLSCTNTEQSSFFVIRVCFARR